MDYRQNDARQKQAEMANSKAEVETKQALKLQDASKANVSDFSDIDAPATISCAHEAI